MAKTSKTKDSVPAAGNGITDIPHEDVGDTITKFADQQISAARVMTPEETAQQEIKKFNLADSAIAALKDKYGGLKISGPEDKDGYKSVREAWGEVRTIRTGLEKKGKELRDGYNLISKKIIKEEGRLIELITPLETDLHSKWKAIDEDKERAENERKAAEEKGFMERLETLQKFGLVLDGGFYSIGEHIQLDAAVLRSMPEDRFLTLRGKAEAIFQEEQAKQAEQLRLARELVAKQKAEREEFERQQQEFKEQRAEMEKQKAELDRQRQEAEKQILESRVNKFLGLGMIRAYNGILFAKFGAKELSVIIESLPKYSNDEFQEFFENISNQIKELKNLQAERDAELEAAARERERREKFIADTLQGVGLTYAYTRGEFVFKNSIIDLGVKWSHFDGLTEEQVKEKAFVFYKQIQAAQIEENSKIKDAEAQAEAERKAGMKDADKLLEIIENITALRNKIDSDEFKTAKFKSHAQAIFENLSDLINKFRNLK